MKEHIVTTYDEDLNSLKSNLTKMGLNVEKQIFQAVDLIKIINISKAKEVVENDKGIDALEKKNKRICDHYVVKKTTSCR